MSSGSNQEIVERVLLFAIPIAIVIVLKQSRDSRKLRLRLPLAHRRLPRSNQEIVESGVAGFVVFIAGELRSNQEIVESRVALPADDERLLAGSNQEIVESSRAPPRSAERLFTLEAIRR